MPKQSKSTKSRKKASTVKKKKSMRWFSKVVLPFLLFSMFILSAYVGYLDYNVRRQFEGKRWSIPAKVFASPVELYVGLSLGLKQFEDLLIQLHYRKDYQLASEATYFKKGQQISLKTRRFAFDDKTQSSQTLRLSFSNNKLDKILNLRDSTVLPLLRMDPIQIGSFYPTRKEDRILIKLEQAPDYLIHGLLATEDRNFYQHFGVSFRAIARAIWANFQAGALVQGGSTITQQLVKNFYLSPEKSLWRKLNEALMALVLEYRYDKDAILEAYLNEIYLGQDGASSVHGFGLASQFYFGRPLENLPLHEIASLVALVRGPSYYDPRKQPDRAISRRNLVLDKMQELGYITKRAAVAAKKQKLNVIAKTHRSVNRYPAFLDLVKRQLRLEYREKDLTSEGLKIFTTLDSSLQNLLETTIRKKLNYLEKKPKVNKLETAMLVTRRDSGEIVALAGGRNPGQAGFNRALDAVRPIGSLIKPVVYLTALEYPQRYTFSSVISDTNIEIEGQKGQIWKPRNYDLKEHGEVELHTALANSYNLATVRIGMDIGLARIAKTLRNLGVSRPVDLFPSLLLGATPLTPLEVTQMYQTLAGDGFASPLRSIQAVVSSEGKRLQSYPYTVKQTVDPSATFITNRILQEAMRDGTGRSAYLYIPEDFNLVGKTGTTNKLRDSWFAGYSGDYLAVTWLGRDDNKPSGLTGATGALQLWTSFMRRASTQVVDLFPPENVQEFLIDPENGLLANEECPDVVVKPYIVGSEPESNSPCVTSPINKAKSWLNNLVEDTFDF